MKRIRKTHVLAHRPLTFAASILLFGLGCSAEVPSEGGIGESPPDEEGETSLEISETHPCGEDTVAQVNAHDGTQLSFCVFESGLEVVFEEGPLGHPSAMREHKLLEPTCGLQVFLELTDEQLPVPQRLIESCKQSQTPLIVPPGRTIAEQGVFVERLPLPVFASHYCAGGGAASFAQERCHKCKPYDDCYDWCVTSAWGWHARTMSSFLGEEANIGVETNASCNGSTRLRGYWREDVGDSWQKKYDLWLKGNYWRTTALIYHSVAIFGQDYDLRLRADSASGAYHRHSGYFLDE